MAASTARLDGVRYVDPLRQGDLSNLCGLYSVLNAVRLACWRVPPTEDQLRALLQFGLRYLIKRRALARVVESGMHQGLWVELGTALINHANDLLGTSLSLQPLPHGQNRPRSESAHETCEMLKEALRERYPVVLGLGGALDHYTVLAGYSEHRFSLFDSSGLFWIEQKSIGLSEHCGKRHWIYFGSPRAVVDTW